MALALPSNIILPPPFNIMVLLASVVGVPKVLVVLYATIMLSLLVFAVAFKSKKVYDRKKPHED